VEAADDGRFAAVVGAFAGDRRVTTGKMMASLGLKIGGKIFAAGASMPMGASGRRSASGRST